MSERLSSACDRRAPDRFPNRKFETRPKPTPPGKGRNRFGRLAAADWAHRNRPNTRDIHGHRPGGRDGRIVAIFARFPGRAAPDRSSASGRLRKLGWCEGCARSRGGLIAWAAANANPGSGSVPANRSRQGAIRGFRHLRLFGSKSAQSIPEGKADGGARVQTRARFYRFVPRRQWWL